MPNQMMNSGTSAIFGIGNSAATTAMPGERSADHSPTARPMPMPNTVPTVQPIASRLSEADRCFHSSPLTVRSHRVARDGDGRRQEQGGDQPGRGGGLPQRDQPDQRRRRGPGAVARGEAAAAERRPGRQAGASTRSRSAAAASSRIIRQMVSSIASRSASRRTPLGQRAVDPQPSRAPRPGRRDSTTIWWPSRTASARLWVT